MPSSAIRPHVLGPLQGSSHGDSHASGDAAISGQQPERRRPLNENYARELMELHTLGVDGGYTQQDVQQLARVLTGVGINAGDTTAAQAAMASAVSSREGAFEFNPARHDFGDKMLLGHAHRGPGIRRSRAGGDADRAAAGLRAVHLAQAGDLLRRRRSAAAAGRRAWRRLSSALTATLPRCCAPCSCAANSTHRWAANSRIRCTSSSPPCASPTTASPITNTQPAAELAQWPGRGAVRPQTPDGYPLTRAALGQLRPDEPPLRDRARHGRGNAGLFEPEDGSPRLRARDFRSFRTACTSRRSSRSLATRTKTRSMRRHRSRNGIRFCCPRRNSTIDRPADAWSMNRRDLLQFGGAAPRRAASRGSLFAAPRSGAALSAGVPARRLRLRQFSDSLCRAATTMKRGPTSPSRGPMPADTTALWRWMRDWALAPAVRDTIGALYQQRQVAFVPFAGTDDLSRSHFETQDSIELGQPSRSRAISLGISRHAWPTRLIGRPALRRSPLPTRCRWLSRARARCPISRSRASASRRSMSVRPAS